MAGRERDYDDQPNAPWAAISRVISPSLRLFTAFPARTHAQTMAGKAAILAANGYVRRLCFRAVMTTDDEVGLLNEQIIAPNLRLVAALFSVRCRAASQRPFGSIDRALR